MPRIGEPNNQTCAIFPSWTNSDRTQHTHIMWTCVYKNGTYVLHHSISRVHFHFLTHKPREFYITARRAFPRHTRRLLTESSCWAGLGLARRSSAFPGGASPKWSRSKSRSQGSPGWNSALVPGHGAAGCTRKWFRFSRVLRLGQLTDCRSCGAAHSSASATALLPSLTLSTWAAQWANNLLLRPNAHLAPPRSAPALTSRPLGVFFAIQKAFIFLFLATEK